MLQSLTLLLDKNGHRPHVITDCVLLIEMQVNNKKGVMGLAMRNSFKGIAKLKQGRMIEQVVNILLDDFIAVLEPYYQNFRRIDENKKGEFSDFLTEHGEVITESLLIITDSKRAQINSKLIVVTYDKMRLVAGKHINQAMPEIGRLIHPYIDP